MTLSLSNHQNRGLEVATTTASHNAEVQLTLPGIERDTTSRENGARSGFDDPAVESNKALPVHRWVPWIAGFSSAFVRDGLNRFLDNHSTVLDPFCGIGTTLVESMLLGHAAIGFEINPYAALASRIKTTAHRIRLDRLREEISHLQAFYHERITSGTPPTSSPPKGFITRSAFYSPAVLRKVLTTIDFIDSLEDPDIRDVFRLAFASTMISYSNYSYEPSLGRRVSAGKREIHDFPVDHAIRAKLSEIAQDISWVRANLRDGKEDVRVIKRSFFEYQDYIAPGSVDLIVTSPPYLNNYHYNRNTRPQLYWLGYVGKPGDMKRLEQANFGKYWQTVRDKDNVELAFSLPDTDLEQQLQHLRELNQEKRPYGGNGWANYAASYFNDCLKFAEGIEYALRPGGTALVVIGNSILQGLPIPTDVYFGKIAQSVGLRLVRIAIPRDSRVGTSIVRSDVRVGKPPSSSRLYEAVVEIRRG